MTRIAFKDWTPRRATRELLQHANAVIAEYMAQGYTLTLRQLHYQLVARDLHPNTQAAYNRLGRVLGDARDAGLVDWDAIEDRARNLTEYQTYDGPGAAVRETLRFYAEDHWASQHERIEVWIEKEALAAVAERACEPTRTPWIACKGYMSKSEKWGAFHRRFAGRLGTILYLGDHDPSGLHMPDELEGSLDLYGAPAGADVEIVRLALTRDQIEAHDPPPNFAKETDTRYPAYVEEHGPECWELDALNPAALVALIEGAIEARIDRDAWAESERREAANLERLREFADGIGA